DRQRRESDCTEWQETYQFGIHDRLGVHQFKIGSDFAHSSYDGRVDLLPVSIIGAAGYPVERIAFGPASRFSVGQNEFAWFAADKWAPLPRLTVDLALRLGWDPVRGPTHAAPRAGFPLMLTKDAKTILKGGSGLFYDRVPLNIASFPFLPGRTVTRFEAPGDALPPMGYTNAIPT